MEFTTSILGCLCLTNSQLPTVSYANNRKIITEKPSLQQPPRATAQNDPQTLDAMATKIITILRQAEKPGFALTECLNDAVNPAGWSERLAERVLKVLEDALSATGRDTWGQALKDAYDKAVIVAGEVFEKLAQEAKEHPELAAVLLTLLAIGVMAVLMPWVLEMLGFAAEGPVAGELTLRRHKKRKSIRSWRQIESFAAGWQRTYSGFVPKGSLFSYLQRLGMVWGKGFPGGALMLAKI
ncbi:hypothetical protein B0T14DRAFT_440991 [Immersiella caudata]|uniref:Uncharacterized protein n=1 Tax=Immersiella caudata TaxID=314043 RepID=A0AA39WAL6_9PEZI|nr:hypothetical protein B0T14DRAFT_440991 [Immersiella caudata]